jgi:hypothetical protein
MRFRFRAFKRTLSKENQAVEYGRVMGIAAVERQWIGGDRMKWNVLHRLEQMPKPKRLGLLRPVARRA